jgi:hypothetical protein
MKIYPHHYNEWADVIAHNDTFILAKAVDGVMTDVVNDGYQLMRRNAQ